MKQLIGILFNKNYRSTAFDKLFFIHIYVVDNSKVNQSWGFRYFSPKNFPSNHLIAYFIYAFLVETQAGYIRSASFFSFPHLPETVQAVLFARRTILGKVSHRGLVNHFYHSSIKNNDFITHRFHEPRWVVRRMLSVTKVSQLKKLCVLNKSREQLSPTDVLLIFIEVNVLFIVFCLDQIRSELPQDYALLQGVYMKEYNLNPAQFS